MSQAFQDRFKGKVSVVGKDGDFVGEKGVVSRKGAPAPAEKRQASPNRRGANGASPAPLQDKSQNGRGRASPERGGGAAQGQPQERGRVKPTVADLRERQMRLEGGGGGRDASPQRKRDASPQKRRDASPAKRRDASPPPRKQQQQQQQRDPSPQKNRDASPQRRRDASPNGRRSQQQQQQQNGGAKVAAKSPEPEKPRSTTPLWLREERAREERERQEEAARRKARNDAHRKVGYVPKLGPIAPEPLLLGGLGPDLNNEERLKKAALREKMKEFGKNVHTVNTVMMPAAPVKPGADIRKGTKEQEMEKAREKRKVMIEFSRQVPKPVPGAGSSLAARSSSGDGEATPTVKQKKAGATAASPGGKPEQSKEHIDILKHLESLEQKHRANKEVVSKIQKEMNMK